MNEELRESGIERIGKIPWGTHISQIYASVDDFDVPVSYIKAGLTNNELCVWIYSQNTNRDEILSLIHSQLDDTEAYLKRGQLLIIPFNTWYIDDVENFNEVRVSRQWVELVRKAVASGYAGLRAVADTSSLDKCYDRDFSRYESNLNAVMSELPFTVICQYNESRIDTLGLADIINNHSYNILSSNSKRRVIENTELLVKNAQYEAMKKTNEELAKHTREVQDERKRFFDVLETLPVMVFLITPDYHITFANRTFREKFGEANGRHCYDYCCGYSRPCPSCESLMPLKTGQPHHWEFTSPDGNTVIDAYDFPFSDTDGSPLILEMDIDITERRRAEETLRERGEQARVLAEALEKKDRLLTDFFINISHEFKTPLTILMLGLELLEAKARRMNGGGDAFLGNLTAMKQNSYRLNRLVGNLLDITKLDAGFMQPKWEEADIAELLRNLAQSVEPYARQRQLVLEYACGPAEIPFMTDSFMLERIVLNLLSNAIKHTPAGGRIRITCRASGGGVSIAVEDTGEGIPGDKQAMIFDRFSQVDTRMTRASEGTGIGLALTKSLVELLGGKIYVESTPGAGSTFTVELPVVRETLSQGGAEQGSMHIDKRVQMELSDVIII